MLETILPRDGCSIKGNSIVEINSTPRDFRETTEMDRSSVGNREISARSRIHPLDLQLEVALPSSGNFCATVDVRSYSQRRILNSVNVPFSYFVVESKRRTYDYRTIVYLLRNAFLASEGTTRSLSMPPIDFATRSESNYLANYERRMQIG